MTRPADSLGYNLPMQDDNPRKTDVELLSMLDEPSGWLVRIGAKLMVPQGNLREALPQALDVSAAGREVTRKSRHWAA